MIYKFSCVVDSKPLFEIQAYILIISLLEILKVESQSVYVHTTKRTNGAFYKWLEAKRINIVEIKPFSEKNPYCNKLQQLKTFEHLSNFDYVFLMDCDTAVLSLDGLDLTEAVYAKPVDFPNPPPVILKTLYKEAGVTYTPFKSSFPLNDENETEFNNSNGGVYIISREFLKKLTPKWKKYANWCIENANLFTPKYSKHADQVAFALAMASLDNKLTHLPLEYNFPIHISKDVLPNISPKIIHFHNELDNFYLKRIKNLSKVDKEIEKVNNFIMNTFKRSNDALGNITHKRDLGSDDLNRAFEEVERPDLLRYIVDVSRANLGFYTAHYPRVFEYSWLLAQLENEKGKRVLDIGAGVCPLPICLNESGMDVTTVDSHPTTRLQKDKANWNEWGFLDYGTINPKIKSTNIDFSQFRTREQFDCIYSISVIEHMPKKIRLGVLKKAATLLKKGGSLLLTIDLIPNTDDLWNLSEDKEVEPLEIHGNSVGLKKELTSLGFKIEFEHIQRNIHKSRTDVYYIKAVLGKKPNFFFKIFK